VNQGTDIVAVADSIDQDLYNYCELLVSRRTGQRPATARAGSGLRSWTRSWAGSSWWMAISRRRWPIRVQTEHARMTVDEQVLRAPLALADVLERAGEAGPVMHLEQQLGQLDERESFIG
jgi:hypothetical protein